MVKGVLSVHVDGCKGIDDDSWFNKADPYAILTIGSTKHKTPTAKGGGKNPVWNYDCQFNVDGDSSIDFRVYDKDLGFDDFMGSAKIPLSSVLSGGTANETVPIFTKDGKQKGHVVVKLSFSGSGSKSEGHASGGHAPGGYHDGSGPKKHDDDGHKKHEGDGHKPKKDKKDKKEKKEKKHGHGGSSSSSSSDSD